MAFRWRADDGPTSNAGLVALPFFRASGPILLENPIIFIFQGVRISCPPSGFVHENRMAKNHGAIELRIFLIIFFRAQRDGATICSLPIRE